MASALRPELYPDDQDAPDRFPALTGVSAVARQAGQPGQDFASRVPDAPLVPTVTDASVPLPDGRYQAAPAANPLFPSEGVLGVTGGTTETELRQPVPDDQGNTTLVRPVTTTDPATGRPYVSRPDPATGVPRKIAVASHFQSPEYLRKEAEIRQRKINLDQQQSAAGRDRAAFTGPWDKAGADLDDATAKLGRYGESPKFMRYSEDGRSYTWASRDPATGEVRRIPRKGPDGADIPGQTTLAPYDTDELIRWQRDGADLTAARDRARAARDKLQPEADRLDNHASQLGQQQLDLIRSRFQHELRLPDDDGGVAMTLARNERDLDEKSREQQAAASLVSSPPGTRKVAGTGAGTGADNDGPRSSSSPAISPPEVPDRARTDEETWIASTARKNAAGAALASGRVTFKPLLTAAGADQTAVFAKAFDGLTRPGELAVGDTGDGYTFIRGSGGNIGSLQKDGDGNPFVVLSNSSKPGSLRNHANLGTTGGIPVYLRDDFKVVHDQAKEARYVADIFSAVRNAPDAEAANAKLAGMGASADDIARKVRSGEISIQHGEALAKEIFHTTLRAENPGDPTSFSPWLREPAPSSQGVLMAADSPPPGDAPPASGQEDSKPTIEELKAFKKAAYEGLTKPGIFGGNLARINYGYASLRYNLEQGEARHWWNSEEQKQKYIENFHREAIDPYWEQAKEELAKTKKLAPLAETNQRAAFERQLAGEFMGVGTHAQELSGADVGIYAKAKSGLNDLLSDDGGEKLSKAILGGGGDIDKAIAYARDHMRESTPSMRGLSTGNYLDIATSVPLKESPAVAQLIAIKARFEKAGIPQGRWASLLKDTVKASAWTENDKDRVRQLSTGELEINPGRVYGDRQGIIDEINASGTDGENKQLAILKLDAMRAGMAEAMENTLHYADHSQYAGTALDLIAGPVLPMFKAAEALGLKDPTATGGFAEFSQRKNAAGVTDKALILDAWSKQQNDRNWVFKVDGAITTGLMTGSLGVYKTVVGAGAGLSALAGADGVAGTLAGHQMHIGDTIGEIGKAAEFGGEKGAYKIASSLTDSIVQVAPMLVGGGIAQGLGKVSALVVGGMSTTGWAAGQGYESSIYDSIETARRNNHGSLTPEQAVAVLSDPKTQIAGFLNGAQSAILSKVLGGGTERAALGNAAKGMTVRDLFAGKNAEALLGGPLRPELKKMAGTIFADMKDEAIEEFLNQVSTEVIKSTVEGRDMKLGDVLESAFQSALMGSALGGTLPQFHKGSHAIDNSALTSALEGSGPAPRDLTNAFPSWFGSRKSGSPSTVSAAGEINGTGGGEITDKFLSNRSDGAASANPAEAPPGSAEFIPRGRESRPVSQAISEKGDGNLTGEISSSPLAQASQPDLPPPAGFSNDSSTIAESAGDTTNSVPPDSAPDSESLTSSPGLLAAAPAVLGKMPQVYRDVFEATRGGMAPPQIAEKFGIYEKGVGNILREISSRTEAPIKDAADAGLPGVSQQAATISSPDAPAVSAPDVPPDRLGKMPQIYRDVFEATRGGMLPREVAEKFSISEKGVANILREITARIPAKEPDSGKEPFTSSLRSTPNDQSQDHPLEIPDKASSRILELLPVTRQGIARSAERLRSGKPVATVLHDDIADLTRQANEQGHLPLGDSMEILNAADRIAAERAARDGTLHEPLLPENFHQLTPEEQAAAIPDAMARLVRPHILPDPQAPAARSAFQTLHDILRRVGSHIAEKFTNFISTARERFRQSMEYARNGRAEDMLSAEGKFTEQERIFPREGRITPASLERTLERLARYDGSALSSKADLRLLPEYVRGIVETTLKQLGAILPPALVKKMHATTITLSDKPDMDHASGKYNSRTGRIRINAKLASRPAELAVTAVHEAGHWVWKNLSNQSRKIILDHFKDRIVGEKPFIRKGRKHYRDHWAHELAGLEDGTEVLTYHLELLALPPGDLVRKIEDSYIRETLEIILGALGVDSTSLPK